MSTSPTPTTLYSYTDEQGVAHIVHSLDEIPKRFREHARKQ